MSEIKRREFLGASGRAALAATASGALAATAPSRAAKPGRRIKVGQIGTGHAHAGGKMSTFRKLEADYEVVGVVEPNQPRRQAAQKSAIYRGLKWMSEEELLNTPGLQVVAVETTVDQLLSTAARSVAAGMNLHLDKPAGTSLSAYKRLLEESSRRGLVVQMGYMFRHNAAFQLCFQAVREGWLGEVFELDGVISKFLPPAARKPLVQYSGGTMFELGCHLIDPMVTVLGKPDRVTSYLRHTRPDEDELADNALAVFEYPKATCTIRSAVVEVEGGRRRQFVVCGDGGTIDIRPLEPPVMQLALSTARGKFRRGYQEVPLEPMPGRYDEQLIELARIVRGEKPSGYPPEHDLAVQEAILRASGMPLD